MTIDISDAENMVMVVHLRYPEKTWLESFCGVSMEAVSNCTASATLSFSMMNYFM